MRVLCYCGADYAFDGEIGPCPKCDRIATTGRITEAEAVALISATIDDELAVIQYGC